MTLCVRLNMYIHYGSDQFDRMFCIPARNCSWKPKPEDGTGLWASRECEIHEDGWVNYGWKEWCEDSHFNTKRLKHFFRFRLSDGAKVIILWLFIIWWGIIIKIESV